MLKKDDKIGVYTLVEKVGAGAFGDVWKAERKTVLDSNFFALKFFRPKDDQLNLDNIAKELEVWKKLKGLPHIISVIELDKFEEYVYVVSDFADGGSLEKYLSLNGNKPLNETEAVKITIDILTGLESLHSKNIIHRDLKPDNILILNGKHCLADFGVSREVKSHSKATGTAGTMEYMPPEAFGNKFSPQTDIWAVGVILQRLLSGQLPFPQDNQAALVGAIIQFEPEKMPELISADLRRIVERCLQKNPNERFGSATEMKSILQNRANQFSIESAKIEPVFIEPKKTEPIVFDSANQPTIHSDDLNQKLNAETISLDSNDPSKYSFSESQTAYTKPFVVFDSKPDSTNLQNDGEFSFEFETDKNKTIKLERKEDNLEKSENPSNVVHQEVELPKPKKSYLPYILFSVIGLVSISLLVGLFIFISRGSGNVSNSSAANKPNNLSSNSNTIENTNKNSANVFSQTNANLTNSIESPTPPPGNIIPTPIQQPKRTPTPKLVKTPNPATNTVKTNVSIDTPPANTVKANVSINTIPTPQKRKDTSDNCVYNGICRN